MSDEKEKSGFFQRLKNGMKKSRGGFVRNMNYVFGRNEIDEDFYDELEETLIMGDIGVMTTEQLLDELREIEKTEKIKTPADLKDRLIALIREKMSVPGDAYYFEHNRAIVTVVGVNGTGKTTTVGKLASIARRSGRNVLIGAADTFRAAAADQLQIWAERAGVTMISSQGGSDPGAVVYDAVSAFKARNVDIMFIDTAGRLQNKKNLMDELGKLTRILDREQPDDTMRETFVVLDATTGQNALEQAKIFSSVTPVTGIVLTKMDGTAKGGIAVAIENELHIPVKFIGVGETVDDLFRFDPDEYVEALFGNEEQ